MKKVSCFILIHFLLFTTAFAQELKDSIVLENRYYNPIDTTVFAKGPSPCIVLFVHSSLGTGVECTCASGRMRKALQTDSLGLREENNIKLYVVYPSDHKPDDIEEFDSCSSKNSILAFDVNRVYKIKLWPYMIFYDGKGGRWTQEGGTYSSLKESIEQWLSIRY